MCGGAVEALVDRHHRRCLEADVLAAYVPAMTRSLMWFELFGRKEHVREQGALASIGARGRRPQHHGVRRCAELELPRCREGPSDSALGGEDVQQVGDQMPRDAGDGV